LIMWFRISRTLPARTATTLQPFGGK